ncbi:MAG: glycerophosphodiester phosphodiesterase family protein [Nocardioidaceae bacterium]
MLPDGFDLQAHRGGAGLTVENTLAAFGHALDLGVTTLECDMHVTLDGVPVVLHDRRLGSEKYVDTGPAVEGDPLFPYVGGLVTDLTVDQLRTVDAGSRTLDAFPGQAASPGARVPLLSELFDLVSARGADEVRFNIETKFDAVAPHETSPRERFAEVVVGAARRAGVVERVSIQSFDWAVLRMVRRLEPRLRLNALVAPRYLETGKAGSSPWLGGIDIDDFPDVVDAVAAEGFDAISPAHGYPFARGAGDPSYVPFASAQMIVRAHELGLRVLPYTVDVPATMHALLDAGVDGMITNYPDRVRAVLAERGMPLPRARPEGHPEVAPGVSG